MLGKERQRNKAIVTIADTGYFWHSEQVVILE